MRLHRPYENGRPLDQGDREKQYDENAERERNRDRTLAAAFLLRLGENDSVWVFVIGHRDRHAPLPDQRSNDARHDLEQEGRKQRKQIEDREGEQAPRGAVGLASLAQTIDV